jgi:hypothetical protein
MIKEVLRFTIVSVETLVWLIIMAVMVWFADYKMLFLSIPTDKILWFSAIPVGLFVWIVATTKTLLNPPEDSKKLLLEWPDYWRLEAAATAAFIHAVGFIILSLIGTFVAKDNESSVTILLMLVGGIAGLSVCAASIRSAELKIIKTVKFFKENQN